ncbi:MAG: zinc-dependent peptidase [Burkholderiales bacterium]|nr:zinc-dependent peptidase [Burkholderiales bacterium]
MFKRLQSWRRQRVLAQSPLRDRLWRRVIADRPLFDGLTDGELSRLKDLAVLLLREKDIHGAAGQAIDDNVRITIAAQACLPILNLGLDYYKGWIEVIVYPEQFVPLREYVDEAGVVHQTRHPLAGESWLGGPLILSWEDASYVDDGAGVNVVIHEFAHKLDMLNGDVNGFPPLHADMRRERWASAFSAAYDGFCSAVDRGEEPRIDPYASESPAEFFAVMSEAFFEIPVVLKKQYPDVYAQLALFYRQDPVRRRPAATLSSDPLSTGAE